MVDFNKVAIISLIKAENNINYGFALYDSEYKILNIGDLVVVSLGSEICTLGTVKNIVAVENYTGNVTNQVIGVVNMDAYNARIEEENKAREVAKKKAAIEKELEKEINKRKTVEFYEEMANKYSDNPRLAELVAELKGLGV